MTKPTKDVPALHQERVALTGKLASMTGLEAKRIITEHGGELVGHVGPHTTILVVGQDGLPLRTDGRLTKRLQKARDYQRDGRIRILTEFEFLRLLGAQSPPSGRQGLSTAQLADLLKVPGNAVRNWVRSGLLIPCETAAGIHYFDFRQVKWAKSLRAFAEAGVPARRIQQSVRQLREWMPNLTGDNSEMALLHKDGGLAVRLDGGTLADPTGQSLFDFNREDEPASASFVRGNKSADACFELGRMKEEAGDLEGASEVYREALLLGGPEPTTCFNLANVLYALGRRAEAVEQFQQVVELEPTQAEAWNNLGVVLADLGRREESIAALRKALQCDPAYADAHYNLGDVLSQSRRWEEAKKHWRFYLTQDQGTRWARYARQQMDQVAP